VVFVANGFTAPRPPDSDDFARLATDERGYLQMDANQMTNFSAFSPAARSRAGPVHLVQVCWTPGSHCRHWTIPDALKISTAEWGFRQSASCNLTDKG